MPVRNGKEYLKLKYKNKVVGTVTKFSETEYVVDLDRTKIDIRLLPVMLYGLDGNKEPTQEQIQIWLGERVVPRNRANLVDYLRAYDLKEYDVWEMLKHSDGNVGTDNWYLEW